MATPLGKRSRSSDKQVGFKSRSEEPLPRLSPRPPQPRARFTLEHRLMVMLLVEARKSAGLSQKSLAEKLGKAQSHVAAIEVGGRDISGVEVYRWCHAVGLPFSEFARKFEAILNEHLNASDTANNSN